MLKTAEERVLIMGAAGRNFPDRRPTRRLRCEIRDRCPLDAVHVAGHRRHAAGAVTSRKPATYRMGCSALDLRPPLHTMTRADGRETCVADIMQSTVITVTPETSLAEAARLARARRIRHLPVLDGGRLVGIISERELRLARPSPATDTVAARELLSHLDRLTVGALMRRIVVAVRRDAPVSEAAQLMVDHKIGALAVTDKGALVGIVTETDLLQLLADAAR